MEEIKSKVNELVRNRPIGIFKVQAHAGLTCSVLLFVSGYASELVDVVGVSLFWDEGGDCSAPHNLVP